MNELAGRTVCITGSPGTQDSLKTALLARGAEVFACSLISIEPPLDTMPLDTALRQLAAYDWMILTSRNAVDAVFQRTVARDGADTIAQPRIAVVGPATAAALEAYGVRASAMPSRFTASEIARTLGDVAGKRVLVPRSDVARSDLPEQLRSAGATVDAVIAYRTTASSDAGPLLELMEARRLSALTFASGSAVRCFADSAAERIDLASFWTASGRPRIVCIGPSTADVARELSVPVDAVAVTHDSDGLVRAVIDSLS